MELDALLLSPKNARRKGRFVDSNCRTANLRPHHRRARVRPRQSCRANTARVVLNNPYALLLPHRFWSSRQNAAGLGYAADLRLPVSPLVEAAWIIGIAAVGSTSFFAGLGGRARELCREDATSDALSGREKSRTASRRLDIVIVRSVAGSCADLSVRTVSMWAIVPSWPACECRSFKYCYRAAAALGPPRLSAAVKCQERR